MRDPAEVMRVLGVAGGRRSRRRWAVLVPVLGALVPLATMLWAARPWQRATSAGDLASTVALIGFALLPYAIAAVVLVTARSVGWLWWTALIYAVIIAVTGIWMDLSIVTDDSSTAAIGFVALPFFQLFGLIAALIVGAIVGLLLRIRTQRSSPAIR